MTPLEAKLHQRIKTGGEISFRDFMDAALYDEEFGYYTTKPDRIGRKGDYFTSSNVSRFFGELIAKQIWLSWQELGTPQPFSILEFGAGTGRLANDVLTTLETSYPEFFQFLTYVICDRSPVLRQAQHEMLAPFSGKVRWIDQIEPVPAAFVLANEFVDALSFHRFRLRRGRIETCQVGVRDGKLVPVWTELASPETVQSYLKQTGMPVYDGHEWEICFEAIDWLTAVASSLGCGAILIIDYGDLSDHLSEERHGTARCFFQHRVNTDFFSRIGDQDITADVNFSALISAGQELGLQTRRLDRQGDFLISLGLLEKLEILCLDVSNTLDSLQERLALKHFLIPGGLGDHFKVLLQMKLPEKSCS
ncbi:MAG TPA: SAM-dependent methyltransferase [Acidobacteriota bacterium]|nr:SAM-dependent methyltransferase [Acidobacteriota bacterium]